jgi:hypothetical protein
MRIKPIFSNQRRLTTRRRNQEEAKKKKSESLQVKNNKMIGEIPQDLQTSSSDHSSPMETAKNCTKKKRNLTD